MAAAFLTAVAGVLPASLGIVVVVVGTTFVVVSGSMTDELIIVVVVDSCVEIGTGRFSNTSAVTSPMPSPQMAKARRPMANSKRGR